ncbi:MAG TPA: heme o synthase [Gammaproteobacteria bacterium]|nr:heme o synthase [Gammaproteobacteria bacterium]
MSEANASTWRDFYELGKPRVVALIVFTAVVGMFLAVPGFPPLDKLLFGTLGIGLAASAAAAVNHLLDQRVDAVMFRTRHRPLPTGQVTERQVVLFAVALAMLSMIILTALVNPLTALLTFFSLIGYAFIYTLFLKRASPQNIVIGGAAGAAPPLLGWAAVTGEVHAGAFLLFLIIFVWTPPHFWALAIHRREDYAKAGIPMLPVTHGVPFTKLNILLYTALLLVVSLLPYVIRMSGLLYLAAATLLGGGFLYHAWRLWRSEDDALPMRTFRYSIWYLSLLFAALLVDHYAPLVTRAVF